MQSMSIDQLGPSNPAATNLYVVATMLTLTKSTLGDPIGIKNILVPRNVPCTVKESKCWSARILLRQYCMSLQPY